MALVSCRECGANVSTEARSCPHCGYDASHNHCSCCVSFDLEECECSHCYKGPGAPACPHYEYDEND